jgi:hypothetical protein
LLLFRKQLVSTRFAPYPLQAERFKLNALGTGTFEERILRHGEMATTGAHEPVPLAPSDHQFEIAALDAIAATDITLVWFYALALPDDSVRFELFRVCAPWLLGDRRKHAK